MTGALLALRFLPELALLAAVGVVGFCVGPNLPVAAAPPAPCPRDATEPDASGGPPVSP